MANPAARSVHVSPPAQVRQHQQGLLSDREAPPSATALDAPLTQRIGQRVFGPRKRLARIVSH
jgi:hypothetical protein